jgi:hypothetical protein
MSYRTRRTVACLVLAVAASLAASNTSATPSPEAPTEQMSTTASTHTDSNRDFDFLRGHWYVRNKRLLKQLQGSTEWTNSSGTLIGMPLLGGMGNYDELRSNDSGLLGVSIRFYDRQARRWSDYWIAHRDGVLQPPVFGVFSDGVGTFEGEDSLDGKPIRVRQLWTRIGSATPRWEQAFSSDGGKTWETNWVMDFSRTPMR